MKNIWIKDTCSENWNEMNPTQKVLFVKNMQMKCMISLNSYLRAIKKTVCLWQIYILFKKKYS